MLLTDFGTRDPYVASMKGVILSLLPQATIVDLTHEIGPQNLFQAACVLEAAYPYFPKGSIFVTVVDPGVGSKRRILAARTSHGIFLAPDNGILSLILEKEGRSELRFVTNSRFFLKNICPTFHGRDCFAPTAARLAKNPDLFKTVGPRTKEFVRLEVPKPSVNRGCIRGEIIFMDHFGNAFTNVSQRLLEEQGKLSQYRVKVKGRAVGPIRESYYEVKRGQPVVVFNSTDLLEIAVNQGSARQKLGLREGTAVEIRQK